MLLTDFTKGLRVRYTGHMLDGQGRPLCGELATVVRPIKSRGRVHIEFDRDDRQFEACPANLERA